MTETPNDCTPIMVFLAVGSFMLGGSIANRINPHASNAELATVASSSALIVLMLCCAIKMAINCARQDSNTSTSLAQPEGGASPSR